MTRPFCRYYDLKNGRVSDSFFNAFGITASSLRITITITVTA